MTLAARNAPVELPNAGNAHREPRPVLLIGPYPPPFGGPGVHMIHLRRGLVDRGAPCAVLNIGAGRRRAVDGAMPVRSAIDFVRAVARAAWNRYHIHHLFNIESHKAVLLSAAAAITARMCGSTYSIGFIGGPSQKYLDRPAAFWTRICKIPFRASEFVICNNERVKEVLSTVFARHPGIHPIQCFHDQQVILAGHLPTSSKVFMNTRRPVLSTVTLPRLETDAPDHELELLIEAVTALKSEYPDVGCVVVGGSRAALEDRYRRMVEDAGVSHQFLFTFELPHEQCLAVIGHSDVFVRAYAKDGNSSSVREALALGVPTVASRNPQHPAAVVPFAPRSGASLTEELRHTLGRLDDLRQELDRTSVVEARSIRHELDLLTYGPTGIDHA